MKNIFKLSKETDRNAFMWVDFDQYDLGTKVQTAGFALLSLCAGCFMIGNLLKGNSGQAVLWDKNKESFETVNRDMKKAVTSWIIGGAGAE